MTTRRWGPAAAAAVCAIPLTAALTACAPSSTCGLPAAYTVHAPERTTHLGSPCNGQLAARPPTLRLRLGDRFEIDSGSLAGPDLPPDFPAPWAGDPHVVARTEVSASGADAHYRARDVGTTTLWTLTLYCGARRLATTPAIPPGFVTPAGISTPGTPSPAPAGSAPGVQVCPVLRVRVTK